MVRAYVLIDIDPAVPDVYERLRGYSLGNCLMLTAGFGDGEVVGRLEADDATFLRTALLELGSQVPGVREITLVRLVDGG